MVQQEMQNSVQITALEMTEAIVLHIAKSLSILI